MSRIHSAPNASVQSLHFPRQSTHPRRSPPPSMPLPNVIPNAPMNISAAIAKFRPSPKEVINAIAPHVFDERRRRRSPRRRGHSPSPQRPLSASHMHMNYLQRKGRKTSSPLRISGVFELDSDGESIVFYGHEQTEHHHHIHHPHLHSEVTDGPNTHTQAPTATTSYQEHVSSTSEIQISQPVIEFSGKRRSRGFRIDSIRILKNIAVKLKSSPRA
ncbi:hypothetical protein E4T56_gene1393 [Termitomyces sp. T112]|nr:hypothetical protein E4T56_gene1393 [Termitomyces sp. T112]KAH0589973.1 hypothetical protein H2248_000156 [Termitomyces sp. 'cryptogamus']